MAQKLPWEMRMSINPVANIATSLIQPVPSLFSTSNANSANSSSLALPQDATPQISGAAQFLNVLEQLATSNPTQFKQVTSQLSARLNQASTQAQSQGDSTQATQLTNLANEFNTASQTGQLPASLANQQNGQTSPTGQSGVAHHGHHHHHSGSAYGTNQSDSSDILSLLSSSSTSSTTTPSTATSASNLLTQ